MAVVFAVEDYFVAGLYEYLLEAEGCVSVAGKIYLWAVNSAKFAVEVVGK